MRGKDAAANEKIFEKIRDAIKSAGVSQVINQARNLHR